MELYYAYVHTPFANALCVFKDNTLYALEFNDSSLETVTKILKNTSLFYFNQPNNTIEKWHNNITLVENNFEGQQMVNTWCTGQNKPELALIGTKFQISVWQQVIKVAFGTTTTYKQIAEKVGKPKAAIAVGANAIGRNIIGYFMPCHRILSASGQLNGYKWGLDLKQKILDYEANFKRNSTMFI